MKIGIYGGSFNPVHNGHIHLAKSAAEEFGLSLIYLIPSKISPHRSSDEYVSEADRLEMLRLACLNDDRLRISDYELRSDRVSYSIYTVEHFKRKFPYDQIYLLVGSDMFMVFDKWYKFREIMSKAAIGVISREKGDTEQLLKKADELNQYGRIFIGKTEPMDISSTEVRKKIVKNCDCSCYLDENVVQYIKSNNLYLTEK